MSPHERATVEAQAGDSPSPMDVETDDVCWICLDDTQDTDPLVSPCKCPRKVHPKCLARWQLQQAGRPEETNCRFCHSNLADWKASLTPDSLKPDVQRVQPIMVVYFEGEIHRIPVKQGPDGLKEFTNRIRELFRLPDDVDISLTFGCKEPMSGQHLKLEGIGAFDAAVHCASVAAAERQQKLKSIGGAPPAGAPGGASSGGGSSISSSGGSAASGSPASPADDLAGPGALQHAASAPVFGRGASYLGSPSPAPVSPGDSQGGASSAATTAPAQQQQPLAAYPHLGTSAMQQAAQQQQPAMSPADALAAHYRSMYDSEFPPLARFRNAAAALAPATADATPTPRALYPPLATPIANSVAMNNINNNIIAGRSVERYAPPVYAPSPFASQAAASTPLADSPATPEATTPEQLPEPRARSHNVPLQGAAGASSGDGAMLPQPPLAAAISEPPCSAAPAPVRPSPGRYCPPMGCASPYHASPATASNSYAPQGYDGLQGPPALPFTPRSEAPSAMGAATPAGADRPAPSLSPGPAPASPRSRDLSSMSPSRSTSHWATAAGLVCPPMCSPAPMPAAAAAIAPGGPLEAGLAANRAARRLRRASSTSGSQHDVTGDVRMCLPTPDETVALGSLTGRLKFTLKAFSRKVARSLNFQRAAGPQLGASASLGGAPTGHYHPHLEQPVAGGAGHMVAPFWNNMSSPGAIPEDQ